MKYRKKPEIVDVVRWDGTEDGLDDLIEFIGKDNDGNHFRTNRNWSNKIVNITVITDRGNLTIEPNDYLTRVTNGKYYPVSADQFAETYERVTADDLPPAESWVIKD